MKTRTEQIIKRSVRLLLLFIVVFILFLLSSCGNDEEKNAGSPDLPENTNVTVNGLEETESEPFDMQEPTDKLTLYSIGMTGITLTPAVNIFKEMYPDVEVEVKSFSEEEYKTILPTELASGKGPDLVFSFASDVADIYKMMSTGVFVDLNHFINNDEDFHIEDYVEGVLDGGVLNGKRYIVPVEFGFPVLTTTQEILDNEGFSIESISTYEGFLNAVVKYHEKYGEGLEKFVFNNSDCMDSTQKNSKDIAYMLSICGMNYINYENNTVEIDKAKFKSLMDTLKAIRYPDGKMLSRYTFGGLYNEKCLFDTFTSAGNLFFQQYGGFYEDETKTHLMIPCPDYEDGVTAEIVSFAAISKASQNQINAYRLLKILLSEEIQGGNDGSANKLNYLRIGTPVLKNAIKNGILENMTDMKIELPEEDLNYFMDILTNVKIAKNLPKVVRKFIIDEMTPYLNGSKTFDECYSRLETTLELYKDE